MVKLSGIRFKSFVSVPISLEAEASLLDFLQSEIFQSVSLSLSFPKPSQDKKASIYSFKEKKKISSL